MQDFEVKLLRNFKAEILDYHFEFSKWFQNLVSFFSNSYFIKIVLDLYGISVLIWKNRLKYFNKDVSKNSLQARSIDLRLETAVNCS